MTPPRWIRVCVPLGLMYACAGVLFALPRQDVQVWRVAAWFLCFIGFAGQIAYEHFHLGSSPLRCGWHVACTVALGAFGLAAAANLHSSSVHTAGQERHLLRLSLVIWPILMALPAFVVALVVTLGLARLPQQTAERHDRPDAAI